MENYNEEINEISNYIKIYFTSSTFEDSLELIDSMVLFEKEFIENIKLKYPNKSESQNVKKKFYEKLESFLLSNKDYACLYGEYLKKLHKTINSHVLGKITNEDDFEKIWKRIKKTLIDINNTQVYAKFSLANLKNYLMFKHKMDSLQDKTFSEMTTTLLSNLLKEKEITLETFRLDYESFYEILKLIQLANLGYLKENTYVDENINSDVVDFLASITENKSAAIKQELKDSEINFQIKCLILKLYKSNNLINPHIILFLTLLFHDFIIISKYEIILENFQNEAFYFSSFKRTILLNTIKIIEEVICNIQVRKYFTLVLKAMSEDKSFRQIYENRGKNIFVKSSNTRMNFNINFNTFSVGDYYFNSFNFEQIKNLITSNTKTLEFLKNSFNDLIKDIYIIENKSTPVINAASKFLGFLSNVVPEKYKKTTNEIQTVINRPTSNYEYNIQSLKIYPYSHGNINPHIYICISGFTSELDEDPIEWEKFIESLSGDSNFFLYKWESGNKYNMAFDVSKTCYEFYKILTTKEKEKNNNKFFIDKLHEYRKDNLFIKARKNSKFYGKILAYIVASRSIFPFQTISLVAFSLGCNLLKSFLKELYIISLMSDSFRVNDIIQNVIFIGGATSFTNLDNWTTYFKAIVRGKIINCYSKSDQILNYLYTVTTEKEAIGNVKLPFEELLSNFFNFDFTFMKMGHSDYKDYLYLIVGIIKNKLKI